MGLASLELRGCIGRRRCCGRHVYFWDTAELALRFSGS